MTELDFINQYRNAFGCRHPKDRHCHCDVCLALAEIFGRWVNVAQVVMECYDTRVHYDMRARGFFSSDVRFPGDGT